MRRDEAHKTQMTRELVVLGTLLLLLLAGRETVVLCMVICGVSEAMLIWFQSTCSKECFEFDSQGIRKSQDNEGPMTSHSSLN